MKTKSPFLLVTAVTLSCGVTLARPIIEFQPKDQTVILYQQAVFGVIAGLAAAMKRGVKLGRPATLKACSKAVGDLKNRGWVFGLWIEHDHD